MRTFTKYRNKRILGYVAIAALCCVVLEKAATPPPLVFEPPAQSEGFITLPSLPTRSKGFITPPPPPALTPIAILPTSSPISPAIPCLPEETERMEAEVVHIIDGDTIDVYVRGETYRVRYIGIDAPEKDEPFYAEASEANRRLVEGKIVLLIRDISHTDPYGRLLRYVLADGVFVNLRLVEEGFANPATYTPDVSCVDVFVQAAERARENGVGLWGSE